MFQTTTIHYLFLASLLLAGCQAFVPVPPPAPDLPQTFRAEHAAGPASDQWWTDLHSPALNNLMAQAFQSAPDIRTARARLMQAQALAAKSGSSLWPEISASASAAKSWNKVRDADMMQAHVYGLGLAASYELDLWGRVRAVRQAGNLEAAATAEDLRTAALSVSGEIVDAWLSLCAAREQRAILQKQLRTNAELLATLELRFANSLSTALDVLEQRVAVAQTKAQIPPLESTIVRLENRISLLLGKNPGGVDLSAATRLPLPTPLPQTGLPADLLNERPDIRGTRLRLEEAGWNVAQAKADRLPALRLTGSLEYQNESTRHILDNWLGNLAASLATPLLDGGRRRAEVVQQSAIQEQRLIVYEQTVRAALTEVDTAVFATLRQQELLDALDTQIAAAATALTSAQSRYENGMITYDSVLSLLGKLQQLELTQIQERAALLSLQTGLCRTLGKGWRSDFPEGPSTPQGKHS